MRVALAQLNPTVGDVPGNAAKVEESIAAAQRRGAELVVCGELSLTGYPPRDLLESRALVAGNVAALEALARGCRGIAALVGFARPVAEGPGPGLEDAAALLADGAVRQVFAKSLLPNYSVYDDPRYFRPGPGPSCAQLGDTTFGVTICEDLWDPEALGRDLYGRDPVGQLAGRGMDLLVNLSASGYQRGKAPQRAALIARQARRCRTPVLYVNQVGGNDEMVFDGGSTAVAADGTVVARAASFREDLLLVDTVAGSGRCEPLGDEESRLWGALALGIGDGVRKGPFEGALACLDGDAASAVVAALAVEALGAGQVRAVVALTAEEGEVRQQVQALAAALGIELECVSLDGLAAAPDPVGGDGSERRLRQRLRGAIYATRAEAAGRLALVPVDKTGLALGRCTPADAMPGALAPLGDVLGRDVLSLARQVGRRWPDIPGRLLEATSGPAYPQAGRIDEILAQYVEQGRRVEEIDVGDGGGELAAEIASRVDGAEYRRRQAPMVLMATGRAFGSGRRFPVGRRYA